MVRYSRKNKNSHKKLYAFLILILVLAVGGYLWWRHHENSKPKVITVNNNKTVTANPNVPGGHNNGAVSGNSSSVGPSNNTNSKDYNSGVPATKLSPGIQPQTPYGDFVSSHSATMSTAESSVCSTTPGADCEITFTNGSLTRKLAAKLTDGNGNVDWNWTPSSLGLSPGSWSITAIAINGSKTASANDGLGPLVVTR